MSTPRDKYANNADAWLANGSIFSRAAKLLFEQGDPFLYFPAALLGQQALEMLLKAALIRSGSSIAPEDVWGHRLVDLSKKLTESGQISLPEMFFEVAKKFDDFFRELRYPQELKKVEELGSDDGWHLDWAVGVILPYARPPKVPA